MKLKIFVYSIFIAVALLVSVFAVTDVADMLSSSSQYVFGTEVGGWKYASRENFIIFNGVQALIGIVMLSVFTVLLARLKRST